MSTRITIPWSGQRPLIFLFAFCLIAGVCFGQSKAEGPLQPDPIHYKHNIGIAAGLSTAYGLSYRYRPGRFGVQATFAPIADLNSMTLSSGLTFLYRAAESDKVNLLFYQGNHWMFNKRKSYIYNYTTGTTDEFNTIDSEFINGIGLGVEFIIVKRVSFNLMFGYAAYDNFRSVNLTGETGLFYMF